MMTAFILASSVSRESKKKVDTNFDLPERWCRHCGSTDISWSESRPLKRMSDSEETCVDRYSCNACNHRFADRWSGRTPTRPMHQNTVTAGCTVLVIWINP